MTNIKPFGFFYRFSRTYIDTISIGHCKNFLNFDVFLSLKVVLILANSVDPDGMQHYAVFIWAFTVYQSTYLGVSTIQRVNILKFVT